MHNWNISVDKRDVRIQGKELPLFLIRISGSLDSYTFPKLEETLKSLYEGGHYLMVVNMEKLSYISSAGLGVLMSTAKKLRINNGDIKLANLSTKIYGILELLGFTTVLETYKSEEEAVNSFVQKVKA